MDKPPEDDILSKDPSDVEIPGSLGRDGDGASKQSLRWYVIPLFMIDMGIITLLVWASVSFHSAVGGGILLAIFEILLIALATFTVLFVSLVKVMQKIDELYD